MTTHPLHIRSEKGVALIMVLLLLGVIAALTTGLVLNGQTEVAMSANETYYAGARSAAEGGMNRAVNQIMADTTTDLLATGIVPVIGNGPFTLNSQYGYSFQILDDDDPALYPSMTPAQYNAAVATMGEDGNPNNDVNTRMILQSIGTGPKSTSVTVARVLQSIEIPDIPETETIIVNPALLVNGDLTLGGNAKIQGTKGNVHANGDITGSGNAVTVTGDVTATGDVNISFTPGGLKAGNMPEIGVPEIKASDYFNLADWVLTSTGTITHANGSPCGVAKADPCPSGWSYSVVNSRWEASGGMPTTSTYYVQGDVYMKGTGGAGVTQLSVIAEGSIKLEGNGKFKPENGAGIQFVTNGDFEMGGTVDADDTIDFDGQIMVREQIKLDGTAEFQGRVMVENRDSATNLYNPVTNPNGRRGTNKFGENSVAGNLTLTYNGHLGDIVTTITLPPGPSTYTNNISGWLEQ